MSAPRAGRRPPGGALPREEVARALASCVPRRVAGRLAAAAVSVLAAGSAGAQQRSLVIRPAPAENQEAPAGAPAPAETKEAPAGAPAPAEDQGAPPEAPSPDTLRARLERWNRTVKVDNPAGVSLGLVPAPDVPAGSRIEVRAAVRKAGYLVLLAVDPAGRLTQIFPDPQRPIHGLHDADNLLRPGRPITVPRAGAPPFTADRATGIAAVIGLLSDRPVEVVDLPGTSPPGFAPQEMLSYVRDQALTLRVQSPRGGAFAQPAWSIEARFFLIK